MRMVLNESNSHHFNMLLGHLLKVLFQIPKELNLEGLIDKIICNFLILKLHLNFTNNITLNRNLTLIFLI